MSNKKNTLVSGWQKPSMKATILLLGVNVPRAAKNFAMYSTSETAFTDAM